MPGMVSRLGNEWTRLGMVAGAGLRWWASELSWLVQPLSRWLGGQSAPLVLIADADGNLHVRGGPAGAACDLVASGDTRPGQDAPDAPGAAPAPAADWRAACAGRQAIVCMDDAHVMRLPITLPSSARSSLRTAVKYKLITESPLLPDEVCFDARIAPKSLSAASNPQEIVADVAICQRSRVEGLIRSMESAGVPASVIGFSPYRSAPLTFVFASSHGASKVLARRWRNRWLAASAVAICLATLPLTYLFAQWATRQTVGEIRALRANRDGTVPLHERRALLLSVQRELAAHTAAPRLGSVLNEVALHLPRTAWLQTIRYEAGALRMTGFASDPAAAADALERSAVLSRVALDRVAATAGEPRDGGVAVVHFELSASIRREAQ